MKFQLLALSGAVAIALASCSGPATTGDNQEMPEPAPIQVNEYSIAQFMGNVQVSGGSFAPDEKSLLISSNKTGIYNAYDLNIETGEETALTTSEDFSIRAISYFPEDKRFLYMADGNGDELFHVYMQDLDGSTKDLSPWEGSRTNFAGWSHDLKSFYFQNNNRDPRFMDLYEVSLETMEAELVWQNDEGLSIYTTSNDMRYLILGKSINTSANDVYVVDLTTKEQKLLFDSKGEISFGPQDIANDNKTMYYTTDEGSEFTYLKTIDLETGEMAKVKEFSWDISYAYHSREGKYHIVGVNNDAKTELHVYDTESGKEIEFSAVEGGDISGVRVSRSEQAMTFYVSSSRQPGNLYHYAIGDAEAKKLTNTLNTEIDPEHLVEGEVIRYKSFDGVEVPAILYKPHQATADAKVPCMLWIHGGPGGQSTLRYSALLQYMVNHGYAVLAVNNRGSSGYGKTFFHLDDRNHGENDLMDCVKAKDYLATLDYIDHDRIGILGGSYGGYMTMAALAFQPEEFAVGVDIFGVTNWLRTLKSIPPWWESFKDALYSEMGDPATDSTRLYNISPVFHADKIKRPFMVLQGAQDPRVLQVESDEIVANARANGVDVEYVVFEDEGHGFVKKENELEGYGKLLKFLDKHLKNAAPAANATATPTHPDEGDDAEPAPAAHGGENG